MDGGGKSRSRNSEEVGATSRLASVGRTLDDQAQHLLSKNETDEQYRRVWRSRKLFFWKTKFLIIL